jgi:hypothetical protein
MDPMRRVRMDSVGVREVEGGRDGDIMGRGRDVISTHLHHSALA